MSLSVIHSTSATPGLVSVADRGLSYGDGLFETIRILPAGPVLKDAHLQRMFAGARRLGINLNEAEVQHQVDSRISEVQGDAVLKLTLTRGVGRRGYQPVPDSVPTLITQVSAYDRDLMSQSGIRVFLCETRLGKNPALSGMKHLNRLEQVLGAAELPDDCAEGVMTDIEGYAVEGTRSNLFFVAAGQLHTPDLAFAGIEGVLRNWLISRCKVRVSRPRLGDVLQATEVFMCNSVFGIYPVNCVSDAAGPVRTFSTGPVTRHCQQLTEAELGAL
ncbi:MAG: aminodeoxychorismate lyase [Pseudomonadales bacterium]|nr:aminodeoxychorismate lyase [Pseudomonadales bacterium]